MTPLDRSFSHLLEQWLKPAGWPQVPCDPKMLISPLDTEGIAKFQLTTLEQQMRQDLPLDGASGIQISMLDIESYAVPENPPPMHPDDKALLMVSAPSKPAALVKETLQHVALLHAAMMSENFDIRAARQDDTLGPEHRATAMSALMCAT